MAFSPEGNRLACGTIQGTVSLWELSADGSSDREVSLPGHRGAVVALAFDPTSGLLASAGDDKSVDVWRLSRLREDLARLKLGW